MIWRRHRDETIEEAVAAEQRLAKRLGDFTGQWVAVENHAVTASAPTLHELLAQQPKGACFFVSDGPFFGLSVTAAHPDSSIVGCAS